MPLLRIPETTVAKGFTESLSGELKFCQVMKKREVLASSRACRAEKVQQQSP